MIKSSLFSIPNYFLSLLTIPASTTSLIEKCFWNFLWNDRLDCRKFHLVDWKLVCLPIQDGEPRIRSLRNHNKVLFGKWLWRFGVYRESLWRKVIVARYALMSEWNLKDIREGFGTGIWKFILKGKTDFWKFIWFKLGLVEEICFWEDFWYRDSPLHLEFNIILICL